MPLLHAKYKNRDKYQLQRVATNHSIECPLCCGSRAVEVLLRALAYMLLFFAAFAGHGRRVVQSCLATHACTLHTAVWQAVR